MSSTAFAAFLKPFIAPAILGLLFGIATLGARLTRHLPEGRLKRLLLLRVGRSRQEERQRPGGVGKPAHRGRTLEHVAPGSRRVQ